MQVNLPSARIRSIEHTRTWFFFSCFIALALTLVPLASNHDSIQIVARPNQLDVTSPECLQLLFNRMTPVPIFINNQSKERTGISITTSSDILGLIPFRMDVPVDKHKKGELVLIPLMSGEWTANLILSNRGQTRTHSQQFCILPPARFHVRIHDSDDQVVAAQVKVIGSDGRFYAPDGYDSTEFRTEGLFELLLPAGTATIYVQSTNQEPLEKKIQVELPANRTVFVNVELP